MIAIHIPGKPIAFARARTNGKQRFTPEPQASYMGAIAWEAAQRMRGQEIMRGPVWLQIRATFNYPKSWTGKQIAAAPRWKTGKPDADNLAKIAADAMNKIVYDDDARIVRMHCEKVYGLREGLTITVTPLDEQASATIEARSAA